MRDFGRNFRVSVPKSRIVKNPVLHASLIPLAYSASPSQAPIQSVERGEGSETRRFGTDAREAREPVIETIKVDCDGGCHMLEMRLGQAAIAGLAQIEHPNALGDRPFDAGALPIKGAELGSGLPLPSSEEGVVFGARAQREGPRLGLGAGAAKPDRADGTVRTRESDVDQVGMARVLEALPAHTLVALGTGDDLGFPVDTKLGAEGRRHRSR